MQILRTFVTAIAISAAASMSFADTAAWTLDPALSKISFGSIKNDSVGESHSFAEISGTVTAEGAVTLELGLSSVQTAIDVRNERMVEHVFQKTPTATITAQLDMAALSALAVGQSTTLETEGTLNLLGTETALDAAFFVMRVSETQVLVTTDGMLMLDLEELGVTTGIDKLQELAKLDSITRVSPVTMRLFFNAGS